MRNNNYLAETPLLNYSHKTIADLMDSRGWTELEPYRKIGATYHFVKDEIAFGYNESDEIPASKVLSDGYGQCNTKAILLMALLRRLGVPCRIHAFRVDKKVQQGIVPDLFYSLAPQTLLHTWTEIEREGRWLSLEGCILDQDYLSAVQSEWSGCAGGLCGYGVAVADVQNPAVVWEGEDTFIQLDSIVEDLGVFDSPDAVYQQYGANLGPAKRFLFKHVVRKLMNRRVSLVRGGQHPVDRVTEHVS
jgi:Transglutaminase-like superfamily